MVRWRGDFDQCHVKSLSPTKTFNTQGHKTAVAADYDSTRNLPPAPGAALGDEQSAAADIPAPS